MFKQFFPSRKLAAHTPLSQFVKMSSAEKKKVYNKAIQEASEEQRALIERVVNRQADKDRIAA